MTSYILTVDFNTLNLAYVSYQLSSYGYKVKSVLSMNDGLKAISENRPCLIISDLYLPHRSGFEFLKKVKHDPSLKEVPFIIMSPTAHTESDVKIAFQLGADKIIFRPIEPKQLMDELKPYLKEYCTPESSLKSLQR